MDFEWVCLRIKLSDCVLFWRFRRLIILMHSVVKNHKFYNKKVTLEKYVIRLTSLFILIRYLQKNLNLQDFRDVRLKLVSIC